jgi:ATP-binding cassette subfamily F protein 3
VLERRRIGLAFRPAARGGQKVLEARQLAKVYGEQVVLLDVNFTLWRGERVGLVGANGAGKSVLFRLLLGEEAPSAGEVWSGPSIHLGQYTQNHETLDPGQTPLDFARGLRPMHEDEAVGLLGRFLFLYRQVREPIASLSGGEKSRLQLLRLMIGGPNCLLLDEPTNHLDIASTEVLEAALDQFDGTVLTISHDRYFLDRVCTRIFELADGEVCEYPGGYSDWAAAKARVAAQREAEASQPVMAAAEPAPAKKRPASRTFRPPDRAF